MQSPLSSSVEAAMQDIAAAVREFNSASHWLTDARANSLEPLAAEVWVFDPTLTHVLLVQHRWRGWVPPGGRVEPGETPREGAARELLEETGIAPALHPRSAAADVRSYKPEWSPTLGLSYSAIADPTVGLRPEHGQPALWKRLDQDWDGYFPDDRERMLWHAQWLLGHESPPAAPFEHVRGGVDG